MLKYAIRYFSSTMGQRLDTVTTAHKKKAFTVHCWMAIGF